MSTADKRIKKLESDYVAFLRNESELQYLRRNYNNAHEWLGRLALETPDVKPGDALRELRARIKEHETAKDRFKKARLLEEIQKLRRVKAQRRGTCCSGDRGVYGQLGDALRHRV